MMARLHKLLDIVDQNRVLRERVHYMPDYDEELGRALSIGANASINTPIVGLEACGTSWMKDIANLGLLISTHDGGVADASVDSYINVSGRTEDEEILSLYRGIEEAATAWQNDFDLEYLVKTQLIAYLPIISGTRMLKDYLDYLFQS